ncbi:MAG: divalent-cation tolerance protein CutA [Candidatus Omnitrophota bacterium]
MSIRLIISTASSVREARHLADCLLDLKLAACVTLLPRAESLYWWNGKREKSREVVMLIKTKQSKLAKAIVCLKAHHSYTVPEIISLPILGGHPAYLKWIRETV